jgi:hypothetical protein
MARARPLILVKPGQILWLKGPGHRAAKRLVRIEDLISHYRASVVECDSDGKTTGAPFMVSRENLAPRNSAEGQQRK